MSEALERIQAAAKRTGGYSRSVLADDLREVVAHVAKLEAALKDRDLKAEGLLNEATDYFAATLPDVDPRAWRLLLTYCPDELLTAALKDRAG